MVRVKKDDVADAKSQLVTLEKELSQTNHLLANPFKDKSGSPYERDKRWVSAVAKRNELEQKIRKLKTTIRTYTVKHR